MILKNVRNYTTFLTRRMIMNSLTKQVLAYAGSQPEGTPLTAKGLLHLSNRAAIDQTLSRLARSGEVMRLGRGVYVRPIQTKFGTRSPFAEKVIEQFATARGETIVSSGAAAANALGLTTQVPVRTIYLTSGRSRRLALGNLAVELRHAKPWQLGKGNARAGQAVRALEWLGPQQAARALTTLKSRLEPAELKELQAMRPLLPEWLAQKISATVATHG
jgi:hypothetical protein